jgi:hypothetical protein
MSVLDWGLSATRIDGGLFRIGGIAGMDTGLLLKIVACVLFFIGGAIFYTANIWARKFGLAAKIRIDESSGLSPEELDKLRAQKAVIRVKLWSLVILLPGIVMILVVFR